MSSAHCTSNASSESPLARRAFETRDFYLACFLRCTGYELLLRDEGGRKVFVFQDRPTRRDDVMAFYCEAGSVRPLERPEGAHSQCMMYPRLLSRTATTARGSVMPSTGLRGSLWTDYDTAFSNIRSLARLAKTGDGNS